jgi:hypothetical protein
LCSRAWLKSNPRQLIDGNGIVGIVAISSSTEELNLRFSKLQILK